MCRSQTVWNVWIGARLIPAQLRDSNHQSRTGLMPIFRYFWFFCAAVVGTNVIIWHLQLTKKAAARVVTHAETRRFTRAAAFGLVTPCVVLGSIQLAAGWTDPFCGGVLSFRDPPSAATSVVVLGMWMAILGWVWLGQGAPLLGRIGSALMNRPGRREISPAEVRLAVTALIFVSGVGATVLSRQIQRPESPCGFAHVTGSGAGMTGLQLVFLGLSAATWLIGGNVLVARHYRRMGKPPWSGFQPFAFPFKEFNATEWLTLLALAALALGFGAIAVSLNPP